MLLVLFWFNLLCFVCLVSSMHYSLAFILMDCQIPRIGSGKATR